ncbi:MAG: cation diffusion facilitator family transporter [Thermodesulfobacteriota bacterium]
MQTAVFSFLVGSLIMGLKFLAYDITRSSAVLSDALESIINVVASAFAAMSIWMAAKPPDMDHPYGHGKIEYFSAGFEGALIIAAACGIFYTGVQQLLHPRPLPHLHKGVILLLMVTMANLLLGLLLVTIGRRTDSIALSADGRHILTDVYTSVGVVAGLGLVQISGQVWLDGAVACLVGLNILFTGGRLVYQSYSRLMDASDPDLLDGITRLLQEQRRPSWIDIHQLRAWRSGSFIHIDLHLVLPIDISLHEAHHEAKNLERILVHRFQGNASVLVHMDPCEAEDCPICNRPDCDSREHRQTSKADWNRERLTQYKEEAES